MHLMLAIHNWGKLVIAALLCGGAIFILTRLLLSTGHGLDFSDDGFNIITAIYPTEMIGYITPAPYVTNALWLISGEEIASFQITGILSLSIFALISAVSMQVRTSNSRSVSDTTSIFLFATIAFVGVTIYYRQLYTLAPSYNSINLMGLLVFQAGLMLLGLRGWRYSAIACFAIGFFFVAGGKPPSTVLLIAVAFFLWAIAYRTKETFKSLALGLLLGIVLFSLFVVLRIEGFNQFLNHIEAGLDFMTIAMTGHGVSEAIANLARALTFTTAKVFLFTQKFTILFIFSISVLAWKWRFLFRYVLSLSLLFSAVELSVHDISDEFFNAYLVTSFVFSCVLATSSLVLARTDRRKILRQDSIIIIATALLFGFLALAIQVFGTNRDPGEKMLLAAVLVLLPSLALVLWSEKTLDQSFAAIVFTGIVVLAGNHLLEKGIEEPFRIVGPIAAQTEPVFFVGRNSPVYLDESRSEYVTDLIDIAQQAGWKQEMYLLNLTGNMPGINLVLNARFVSFPWYFATPEGQDALNFALERSQPDKLAGAWVLTTRNGRNRLDPEDMMLPVGSFPCDYTRVGTFPFDAALHYRNGPVEVHELWKPSQSDKDC